MVPPFVLVLITPGAVRRWPFPSSPSPCRQAASK